MTPLSDRVVPEPIGPDPIGPDPTRSDPTRSDDLGPGRRARVGWFERARVAVVAVGAAIMVVVSVTHGWKVELDKRTNLGAAPLVGKWRSPRFGSSLLIAGAIAAVVVAYGPVAAARWRFRRLLAAGGSSAVAFALALAASGGRGHILDPVVNKTEYWANLKTLPPAGEMLRQYGTIRFLLGYSVHAKGHPPGFLLLLKALAAVGLGHPWVAGALSYLGIAGVVVAVAATVRIVAGEDVARRCIPLLIVAPYAVWMGTSADAFYAAVVATGVFLLAAAVTSERPARRRATALAGGVTLASALFLTYGATLFMLLPVAVVVALGWRRWRAMLEVFVLAGMGAAAVTAGFSAAGFWWFDGLATTRTLYHWGTAQFRPAKYFFVANIAAAGIACGPAVVLAVGRRRRAAVWLLVGITAVCLLAANASQYSKGEVERIWLMFFPWFVPAAVALHRRRSWIAVQAAFAIGLQLTLVSKW